MKKPQKVLIIITAVFICLLVGIFVGRNFTGNYIALNSGTSSTQATSPNGDVQDGRIDINTATLYQLQLLPGIGQTLAQRIIDYRTEHGDFKTVDDLLNVSGIGESKLGNIKPYIKIG